MNIVSCWQPPLWARLLYLPLWWLCSHCFYCFFASFTPKSSALIVFLNLSTGQEKFFFFFPHPDWLDWLLLFGGFSLLCPHGPVRLEIIHVKIISQAVAFGNRDTCCWHPVRWQIISAGKLPKNNIWLWNQRVPLLITILRSLRRFKCYTAIRSNCRMWVCFYLWMRSCFLTQLVLGFTSLNILFSAAPYLTFMLLHTFDFG